jgi:hypothetical protein
MLRIRIRITLGSFFPPFHFDADPDLAFQFDAEPDPAFHFDSDPDPAFHFDSDPDPAFHFDSDPDPHQSEKVEALERQLFAAYLETLHCCPISAHSGPLKL